MTGHPPHLAARQIGRGDYWEVSPPEHPYGKAGRQLRARCVQDGGHFWHHLLAGLACCQCGAPAKHYRGEPVERANHVSQGGPR